MEESGTWVWQTDKPPQAPIQGRFQSQKGTGDFHPRQGQSRPPPPLPPQQQQHNLEFPKRKMDDKLQKS
jgi:hypothetical protein